MVEEPAPKRVDDATTEAASKPPFGTSAPTGTENRLPDGDIAPTTRESGPDPPGSTEPISCLRIRREERKMKELTDPPDTLHYFDEDELEN